jgi:hypothetical protein
MNMCSKAAIPFITSGIGAGMGLIQNATDASATAKAAERTAKLQKQQGDQAYADMMDDVRRRLASQRVSYAKGGVTADGSPSDVLASMARDGDVAARTARDRGYEEARNTLLDAKQRNPVRQSPWCQRCRPGPHELGRGPMGRAQEG